jgi:formylglycine-generating enzyme required for sulfatase activity
MSPFSVTSGGVTTKYCVDNYEVSWGEYHDWYTTTAMPASAQAPECLSNASFAPSSTTGTTGAMSQCDLYQPTQSAADRALPVVCVSLCDARAYCTAQAKSLCGNMKTGGAYGITGPTDAAPATDDTLSEWYAQCSHDATYSFAASPAGVTGDVVNWCNVKNGVIAQAPTGAWAVTGGAQGCHAPTGALPNSGVLNVIGNVWEWDDGCTANGDCLVRGCSFANDPTVRDCSCSAINLWPRTGSNQHLGFRCCSP